MKVWLRQLNALATLAVLELYRRKDLVVVGLLSVCILGPLALFAPFGVHGASRYMNELALLLIWIFSGVIALSVAARLFPPEFENRTIFPLLAKPVGRGTLLLGKYLGACVASCSVLAVFYLIYGLLTGLRQGGWFPEVLIQAFVLHIGFVLIVTALGLLGSLILTASANLTLCGMLIAGMLFYGQRLPALAATQSAPTNVILTVLNGIGPHLEFFDLRQRVVHEWGAVGWSVCFAALAYAVVYVSLCLLLASRLFRRRKL